MQAVLSKKDYYEILGLTKGGCTEKDIKKAFHKMSLKVHPDKNRAPKAGEAFKKVNQAHMCLSDARRRAVYDERGTEEEARVQQHHYQYYQDPADDLFDMFFGGGHAFRQRRP